MSNALVAYRAAESYDAISVLAVDALGWIQTSCEDFTHYVGLPQVVKFADKLFEKRGWNSDKNLCYYAPGLTHTALAAKEKQKQK